MHTGVQVSKCTVVYSRGVVLNAESQSRGARRADSTVPRTLISAQLLATLNPIWRFSGPWRDAGLEKNPQDLLQIICAHRV